MSTDDKEQIPTKKLEEAFASMKKHDEFNFFGQDCIHLYNALREAEEGDAFVIDSDRLPIVIALSLKHLTFLDIQPHASSEDAELSHSVKETRKLTVRSHIGLEYLKKINYKKNEKERIRLGIESPNKGEEMIIVDLIMKEADEFVKLLTLSVRSVKEQISSLKAKDPSPKFLPF